MVCKIALRSLDIVSERGSGCFVWAAASFDLDHREWRRIALAGLLVERLILVMLHGAPRGTGFVHVRRMSRPARRPFGQRATCLMSHAITPQL